MCIARDYRIAGYINNAKNREKGVSDGKCVPYRCAVMTDDSREYWLIDRHSHGKF